MPTRCKKISVLLSKSEMARFRKLEYAVQLAISPAELKVYEKEIKLIIEHGVERAENQKVQNIFLKY